MKTLSILFNLCSDYVLISLQSEILCFTKDFIHLSNICVWHWLRLINLLSWTKGGFLWTYLCTGFKNGEKMAAWFLATLLQWKTSTKNPIMMPFIQKLKQDCAFRSSIYCSSRDCSPCLRVDSKISWNKAFWLWQTPISKTIVLEI